MRKTRMGAAAAMMLLAVSFGGCAELDKITAAATSVTAAVDQVVTPTSVIIASNAFDAVQATADKYLRLPHCSTSSSAVCRNPAVTRPLVAALKSGRKARDAAQDYVKAHGDAGVPTSIYNLVTGSVKTIQSIFDTYNVEVAVQ